MRIRSIGGPLLLAMLIALLSAASSRAADSPSTFNAMPGGVSFEGDPNRHTIQILDSDRNLEDRQWELEPDWRRGIKDGLDSWSAQVAHLAVFDENGEINIENPIFLAAMSRGMQVMGSPRVPADLKVLVEKLVAKVVDLKALQKRILDVPHKSIEKLETLVYELDRNSITPAEAATRRAAIGPQAAADVSAMKATRDSQVDGLRKLIIKIEDEHPNRLPEVDEALDSAKKMVRNTEVIGDLGLARLAVVGAIASVALTVASAYEVYGIVTSGRSILVIDSSGTPIEPGFLCSRVVRRIGGGVIPNAAACPALRMPLLFGSELALKVNGGDAADNIQIRLSNKNPFTSIDVRGLGGNDTIEGTALGDRLAGGGGNDTIYGHGGNDRILGDIDIVATSAPGDDMLFGGAGNDFVYGQAGDDLVVGGKDDDATGEGIALSGGLGNDVIVGGSGADEMNGGPGRDTVLAKESDFTKGMTGGERQIDVYDPVVDCGEEAGGTQYFTRSNVVGPDGYSETPFGCGTDLGSTPGSLLRLLALANKGDRWPWLK